jgi:limonene-1,2-epoxide hydrolase
VTLIADWEPGAGRGNREPACQTDAGALAPGHNELFERAPSSHEGETTMPSASDADIDTMILEFFRAWERQDADHVASCFTEDAIYHNIPFDPIVSRGAIREFLDQPAVMPPIRIEVHHQVVSGDIVLNERTDTMTINGQEIAVRICGVFEILDGHIQAWREYFDPAPLSGLF